MRFHTPLRRLGLATVAAATLALGSLVAISGVSADVDPSDGDVTFEGQVTERVSGGGLPGDVGIAGLDVTVYVDDGVSQRPIGTLETDDDGRFELEVSVADGEVYTFSASAGTPLNDYFWAMDPLEVITELDLANWVEPPTDAP